MKKYTIKAERDNERPNVNSEAEDCNLIPWRYLHNRSCRKDEGIALNYISILFVSCLPRVAKSFSFNPVADASEYSV